MDFMANFQQNSVFQNKFSFHPLLYNLTGSGKYERCFNISIMKRKPIINSKLTKKKDYELTVLHIWKEFTYPAYLEAVKKGV